MSSISRAFVLLTFHVILSESSKVQVSTVNVSHKNADTKFGYIPAVYSLARQLHDEI